MSVDSPSKPVTPLQRSQSIKPEDIKTEVLKNGKYIQLNNNFDPLELLKQQTALDAAVIYDQKRRFISDELC